MPEYQQYAFTKPAGVEYWNEIYARRDFLGDRFRERMNKALAWLDDSNLPAHSRILDVGSGAGQLTNEAARRGYDVCGVDYSYEMLAKAAGVCQPQARASSLMLQGHAECLPFQNSSFDMIFCLGVIPHVTSPENVLRELARLLKPGGTLVFSFDNRVRLVRRMDIPVLIKTIIGKIARRADPQGSPDANKDRRPGPRTHFFPTIRKILASSGIRVIEYETISVELFTLFGREILPGKISIPLTLSFDRFSNVPLIGSLGGQCVVRARRCLSP
jgi:2-polyprenyl-3-methyl-5-hydroxy-6-metoxy-1,4-benzoquinol methylase